VYHDEAMLMLKAITTAFDEHDLEGIMVHFAADAVFEGPRGTESWGTRVVGRDAVREAFAARFAGIPTSAIGRMSTSSLVTGGHRSGACPERRPRDSGSKSEAAICGPSARARS
jgi:hypothetical protein